MPKILIYNYVLVLLLLTNNFMKIFDYVESKNLNDICAHNSNLRKKIKENKTVIIKFQIKKYLFVNLKKKIKKTYDKIKNVFNRNDINRNVCVFNFSRNNLKKKLQKKLVLTYETTENKNSIDKKIIKNYPIFCVFEKLLQKKNLNNNKVKIKLKVKKQLFLKKENSFKIPQLFFINICVKNRNQKKRNSKKYLRKYEELYQIFTPEENEENEENDYISKVNRRNISNIIINEWCISKNENKYNLTLMYDYISNMHNTEYEDVKSINNLIKNNELIEKEEYKEKRKPYLTYKYKYKYLNPIDKTINFYEYEYYIPKLITYEEDISTESKFVPSNFNSPKCYNNSPINFLTTSGFSSRNIDTFGKERNKIYSFNTPTDVKRNIFFNDLMLISSSYNQHFFSNLCFLLNLHTLQILIRDKTAIETDFIIDKFDQLKERLMKLSSHNSKKNKTSLKSDRTTSTENKNVNDVSCCNFNSFNSLLESDTEMNKNKYTENEKEINEKDKDIINKVFDGVKKDNEYNNNVEEKNVSSQNDSEENSNDNDKIDEEISRHLTYKKSLFDDKIQIYKNKYDQNILEDKEFINLWKYDENGEIVEKLNKVPIPKIYLNIDDPKFCMWKILQNSGKFAFKEIPTPNRKLEAWRQQINLKSFYKQNFDTSISLRNISKEELINFKMKIIDNSHMKDENMKNNKKENHEEVYDKNNSSILNQKKIPEDINLYSLHNKKCENPNNEETLNKNLIEENYDTNCKIIKSDEYSSQKEKNFKTESQKEFNNSNCNKESQVDNYKNQYKNAFYTLVVRDGIVDEYLSDDISIIKKLNNELKESAKKKTEDKNNMNEYNNNENTEKNKSKIFVGSFFNVKDVEVEYLINKELYFIPEYSNWHKKNTQPFIRGQIGKQSRKFDNDYPIYDYRKSDFGMAKFSSLNLASIKDCAVIYLDEDIDLSDKFIHVIFIATSKNEDDNINNDESRYSVFENTPINIDKEDVNKNLEGIYENNIPEGENRDIDKNKIAEKKEIDKIDINIDSNLTENYNTEKTENEKKYIEKEKSIFTEKKLKEHIHNPIINPRLVVYVKRNSKLNIYESHISLNKNNSGLVNAFSRISLEEKSTVKHTLSQELGNNVWHFHNVSVKNGLNANYKFVDILLGSLSSRVNLQIEGENKCKQESYGLALLNDKQNISQYEMFHHEHPYMDTNQLFKFLVSDKAHAVWRSRGRIERNAIKAKLNTLCRSILLNFGASAVSIPTLEIIPNDIEYANHGATISDLEKEPIFVLMTRGISEKLAREIMMKSFVNEILEHISDENLKNRVYQKLLQISLKCNRNS
ncbi:iron-sulfur assembly protein, sufD, putative [Plasmodium gallinaceum]|uniref:Iron-sulfur assembly protein, sufD, putative n=1 Tax=Plasmodium gallinaceum TaxID=5849 RepID=A0A1J1GUW4_PLAGA|nr:iron-sulfur assembly protein, sufD, putative [Plasmodium gallinaceum]CRG96092.1 iron-sulfur assembly protein, sufD, putative [Plasmodium gallinaceum]